MADGRLIFNVRQFGAGGDGKTKDTAPIQKAIDACNAARGGIVYFTPGDYLTNTIVLKSHVTLYLESGATIVGGRELADWTHFPYTANAPRGGRHLVYADEASNIGIMGPGRIHGSGDAFRRKKTEAEIAQMFASRPDGWRVAIIGPHRCNVRTPWYPSGGVRECISMTCC
jgi:polygalacturonase